MMKNFLFLFFFTLFLIFPDQVYAGFIPKNCCATPECENAADIEARCGCPTCGSASCQGVGNPCDVNNPSSVFGACTYTCIASSNCLRWGEWGACVDGYKTRVCATAAFMYEIAVCGGSTGGSCKNTGWTSATNWRCAGSCAPGRDCKKGATKGSCQCKPNGPGCTPAAPSVPTLLTPAIGTTFDVNSTTLDWSDIASWGMICSGTASNIYSIYAGTTNPPTTLIGSVSQSISAYEYLFPVRDGSLRYWQVVASNGAASAASSVYSFYLPASISGTVYDDVSNTCSTATPSNFGGTAKIKVAGYPEAAVAANGTFSIPVKRGSYTTVTLQGMAGDKSCSTCGGVGCPTKSFVGTPPGSGNNFFISSARGAWWQAEGAGIYAGSNDAGATIVSSIPGSVPSASRYLVTASTGGTPAAVVHATGTVSTLAGTVNAFNWQATSTYKGKKMDYGYFAPQIGVKPSQLNDWLLESLSKPAYVAEKTFYYMKPDSGTATMDATWNVFAGESYIVIVNGNVVIPNNIVVANGGFLTIIAKGNITVNPGVTRIDGLFVMDNDFLTLSSGLSNDAQLVVNGSVVAWGSFQLERDMGAANSNSPAEKFVYRPDFLVNMPASMKTFVMEWKEVPSGTFGN